MLYFIHHPAGPVVIRTSNPYIVLQYQHKGWHTTTSWAEVLEDHPEWQAPRTPSTPDQNQRPSLTARILGALSSTLAILLAYAPTGVSPVAAAILAAQTQRNNDGEAEEWEYAASEPTNNTGPIHFMSAIPRSWYRERALSLPTEGWVICTEGDEVFNHRLEQGVWQVDVVPEYAEEA
jgi:hypothetical protein